MTFDRLVNMYLIESKKSGPPYIVKNEVGTYYYKDSAYTILHRLDGPAIEWNDGTKFWFVDGKYHRLDGPAVEYADGSKEWYVDDKELTKEEFDEYLKRLDAIKKVSKVGNRLSSELIKGLFD